MPAIRWCRSSSPGEPYRAGFISARAYRTSFRTALTATVQQSPAVLDLPGLKDAFLRHWRQKLPNAVDFVATFLPADLEWLKEWAELEKSAQPVLPPDSPPDSWRLFPIDTPAEVVLAAIQP